MWKRLSFHSGEEKLRVVVLKFRMRGQLLLAPWIPSWKTRTIWEFATDVFAKDLGSLLFSNEITGWINNKFRSEWKIEAFCNNCCVTTYENLVRGVLVTVISILRSIEKKLLWTKDSWNKKKKKIKHTCRIVFNASERSEFRPSVTNEYYFSNAHFWLSFHVSVSILDRNGKFRQIIGLEISKKKKKKKNNNGTKKGGTKISSAN